MVEFRLIAELYKDSTHHDFLIKMIPEILFFLLGCLVGWFTNHWYSVLMKRPSLILSGGGGSSNFHGSGFHSTNITIQNELRKLGISLPETVILGKQLRTDFGGQIVERETARQCRAQLVDLSKKHICHLWWFDGTNVDHTIEIKSGEAANLILFLRRDNVPQYFAYEPTSSTDPTPKTSDIPRFDKTMRFFVEVSYSHGSQKLRFPIEIIVGYDGRISYETPNTPGYF